MDRWKRLQPRPPDAAEARAPLIMAVSGAKGITVTAVDGKAKVVQKLTLAIG